MSRDGRPQRAVDGSGFRRGAGECARADGRVDDGAPRVAVERHARFGAIVAARCATRAVTAAPANGYHVKPVSEYFQMKYRSRKPAAIPINMCEARTRVLRTPTRNAPRIGPAGSDSTARPASSTERSIS